MPWGRVDDDFYDHPKVEALGARRLPCVGLYFLAISWSNRYLTDGRVPLDRIRKLGGSVTTAQRLVEVGLFDLVDGEYSVHDFLAKNKSREQVEAEREVKAEAGRKGGLSRGKQIRDEAEAKHGAKHAAKQTASTLLSTIEADGAKPPSRPVPLTTSTPTPLGAVGGPTAGESSEEPRLTRAQLDAWASFADPAWEPFKAAWLGKGLRLPPFGEPDDDPDTSQRARLWRIADDAPQTLGRWVAEAPCHKAHEIIAYVFAQRAKVAAAAEASEAAASTVDYIGGAK